jgi:hypothetical protein
MISRLLTVAAGLLTVVAFTSTVAMAACASPVKPDATDPALRQLIVGTWYNATQQQGMTQQIYQNFLITGVWDYRDETCSPGIPGGACRQNYGHGVWMATRQADGRIYIRVQFSDLTRQNDCTGWVASFPDNNTMVSANGAVHRRVR